MNQKKSSHGPSFFLAAIALMAIPEWLTIFHFIDDRSVWMPSMILSVFLMTLAYRAWQGAGWAKHVIVGLVALGVLIKVLSLTTAGLSQGAMIGLACNIAGLGMLLLPGSVHVFLESQRRERCKVTRPGPASPAAAAATALKGPATDDLWRPAPRREIS